MTLLPRFIEPKILEMLQASPVVIVEGARAVGKTSLVQKLKSDGHMKAVYSMADLGLRNFVEADPVGWLRSLEWPCAIDEAQLVPMLPVAIKQVLDETGDGISLLLTGSSSIGQAGFGGTDPLARRALRVSLEPLSEAELRAGRGTWSVLDALFGALPVTSVDVEPMNVKSDAVVRGGMPQYRLMQGSDTFLGRSIDEGIRSILTQRVKPSESFDQVRAFEILSYVLRHPASELNISEIGRELSMDRRTVDVYLDALEKRFLLYEVPNVHRPSKRSLRSSAKFFAADVALAAHALAQKSDVSLLAPDVSGRLVEAFVMQQIRAHAGWAKEPVEVFHWRQMLKGKALEVDVVVRDASGALVALEVKSSARVKPEFVKGLKAFREAYADDFRRGFVVCNVKQAVPLGEDFWAIPFETLFNPALWQGLVMGLPQMGITSEAGLVSTGVQDSDEPVDVELVVSFSAADDGSVLAGDIHGFARDVADAVEGLSGMKVGLVLDDDPAHLGEGLEGVPDAAGRLRQLVLAVVTPRWGKQVGDFSVLGESNVVSAMWITTPQVRQGAGGSVLDMTDARRAERGSAQYRVAVEQVAESLLAKLG